MRETEPGSGQYRVHTAIDFGDSHVNPLVFELAITIMYTMTKVTARKNPQWKCREFKV